MSGAPARRARTARTAVLAVFVALGLGAQTLGCAYDLGAFASDGDASPPGAQPPPTAADGGAREDAPSAPSDQDDGHEPGHGTGRTTR